MNSPVMAASLLVILILVLLLLSLPQPGQPPVSKIVTLTPNFQSPVAGAYPRIEQSDEVTAFYLQSWFLLTVFGCACSFVSIWWLRKGDWIL